MSIKASIVVYFMSNACVLESAQAHSKTSCSNVYFLNRTSRENIPDLRRNISNMLGMSGRMSERNLNFLNE